MTARTRNRLKWLLPGTSALVLLLLIVSLHYEMSFWIGSHRIELSDGAVCLWVEHFFSPPAVFDVDDRGTISERGGRSWIGVTVSRNWGRIWDDFSILPRRPGFDGDSCYGGGYALPLWIPFAALALPAAFLWWWQRPRRRPGTCRECGYDLRASGERCPECGTPSQQPNPTRSIDPRRRLLSRSPSLALRASYAPGFSVLLSANR